MLSSPHYTTSNSQQFATGCNSIKQVSALEQTTQIGLVTTPKEHLLTNTWVKLSHPGAPSIGGSQSHSVTMQAIMCSYRKLFEWMTCEIYDVRPLKLVLLFYGGLHSIKPCISHEYSNTVNIHEVIRAELCGQSEINCLPCQ